MPNYNRTKRACYFTYLATSSSFGLPPLLFVTFRETYGISYTLLGTLVLINFCTQMIVDLIFTFFGKHFNIHKTVKNMTLLASLGMLVYAIVPWLFPDYAFLGMALGTVIFSIAVGLCEVLVSPLVAAIPGSTDKDMSALHSIFCYGLVLVIGVSTVFLQVVGHEYWMYLAMFWAILPLISYVMFSMSPLPEMNISQAEGGKGKALFPKGLLFCVACIFLGGAAENTMTNWISGYMENALGISKVWGDILGMALFAVLMAITRTIHSKRGGNISKILLLGMIGSTVCYWIAGLSPNRFFAMGACVLMGVCTSMLWPGNLIYMEEKFPNPGVAAYALMAAGGDLGGSVAPQLLGAVTDMVSASSWAKSLGAQFSLTAEQIGMKAGMLTASLFPLLGIFLLIYMRKKFKDR